jgi:hypothetical protein
MNVRKDFEPFGAVKLGDEVGEGELQILRPQMIRQPQVHIVAGERLAIALGS